MYGDIVFVERKPLWLGDIEHLLNEKSCWLDRLIVRFVLYKHYGIEIEDEKIIHFYCPSIFKLKEGIIEIVSKEEFLKNEGIIEIEKNIKKNYTRNEIVNRAKSVCGTDFGGYHINRNNCEDFAVWCSVGKKSNRQTPLFTTKNTFKFMSVSLKSKIVTMLAAVMITG
jgi:hypothetical protein